MWMILIQCMRMQDELRYDSEFLELVEDGFIILDNLTSTDIANKDNFCEFYVNFFRKSLWNRNS